MGKGKTRSPLKANPLRNPGQSLDEEIDRILNDKILNYILMAVMAAAFAAWEWYRAMFSSPPQPWLLSFLAAGTIIFAVIKLTGLRKQLKNLRQGRDGERAVGQYLEELRESGCKVFHDIVADNFNIDHVVLSEKGFFLIETKTYSKPLKGEPKVLHDGDRILVNGYEQDRSPVVQARASARWLHDFLKESTGKSFPIKPVVLFPGWFVDTTAKGKASDTWVLNPKGLEKYITNQAVAIPSTDVHLAKSRISAHIRSSNSGI